MERAETNQGAPALRDGAYGTLLAPDLRSGELPDTLTLREPGLVARAHARYVEAGALVIGTNTFMAWTLPGPRRRELYRAALELAREAADPAGAAVVVTIGPAGREPRAFYEDLEFALDHEAHLIRCETVTDLDTARAFVRAWDEVARGAPAVATLSLSIAPSRGLDRWRWIAELEATTQLRLGLNCAEGPAGLREPLMLLAERSEERGVELAPSAGLPAFDHGTVVHPWSPADWADAVIELCAALPIALVGGCCGTTPDHIAALAERLRS